MPLNTENELRNLDQLPKWKQRLIIREREKEKRLRDDQMERDFRNNTGYYHPEAVALRAKQEAERLANQYPVSQYPTITKGRVADALRYQGLADLYTPTTPTESMEMNRQLEAYDYSLSNDGILPEAELVAETNTDSNVPFWKTLKFKNLLKDIKLATQIKTTSLDGSTPLVSTPNLNFESIIQKYLNIENLSNLAAGAGIRKLLTPRTIANEKIKIVTNPSALFSTNGSQYETEIPKFLFDENGIPFQTDSASTEDVVQQAKEFYADDPNPIKRVVLPWFLNLVLPLDDWLKNGFTVGEAEGVTVGGQFEEEMVYQETTTSGQALVQSLYNFGVLGIELLGYMATMGAGNVETSAVNNLDNPTPPPDLKTRMENQGQRVKDAWNALSDSWGKVLNPDIENLNTASPTYKQDLANRELELQTIREEARVLSVQYSDRAFSLYNLMNDQRDPVRAQQLYEEAVSAQIQSIEQRRIADPYDVFGAATWQREPEKYEVFIRQAAFLELQMGRPLSIAETRRLKDQYTNIWTEIGFQLVFDITNLSGVVGAALDGVSKVPIVAKILKPVGVLTDSIKTTISNTDVVRFITKKAVRTIATQLSFGVTDTFSKMSKVYGVSADFIKHIPEIEKLVSDVKLLLKAGNVDGAMILYDKAVSSGTLPAISNISFDSIKRLGDMDVDLKGQSWVDLYADSFRIVEESIRDNIKLTTPDITDEALEVMVSKTINKPKGTFLVNDVFGKKFSELYIDANRIFENSPLLEGTITGAIAKRAAIKFSNNTLSTKKALNPKLMDKYTSKLISEGITSNQFISNLNYALQVNAVELFVVVATAVKEVWATVVLTSPRFVISNFIDSMGRVLIYGSNPFDDVLSLMSSTYKHFSDEIGFIPSSTVSSLSRGLNSVDSQIANMIFDGKKFSLLDSWKTEYKKLKQLSTTSDTSGLPAEIANRIATNLPSQQGNWFKRIFNFMSISAQSTAHSVSELNNVIEFTLRTRQFHKEYFRLLKQIEPKFIEIGMENVPDSTKQLMKWIWKEAGGNPARIASLVDSIIKPTAKTGADAKWSFLLPSDWMDTTKMSPEHAQALTYHLKVQTQEFISSTLKSKGRVPTADEFITYIEDAKKKVQDGIQSTLDQMHIHKTQDTSINPKKEMHKIPTVDELKGAAPVMDFGTAIKNIQRKQFKKFDSSNILESYKSAISNLAETVSDTSKEGIQVIKINDKVTITLGDVSKLTQNELYTAINDATIKVIGLSEEKVLKEFGTNPESFSMMFRTFLIDPAKIANDNPEMFVLMVQILDADVKLRDLLKVTGTFTPYGEVAKLYYESMSEATAKAYLIDSSDAVAAFRKHADDVHSPGTARRKAGVIHAVSATNLANTSKTINNPKLIEYVSQYQNMRELVRNTYREFALLVYPGPRKLAVGKLRANAWDMWEKAMSDAYKVESDWMDELTKLIKTNPDEAILRLEDDLVNYQENYLRRLGFDIVWDNEEKTKIIRIRHTINQKVHTYFEGEGKVAYIQQAFFGDAKQKTIIKLAANPDVPLQSRISYALTETFGLGREEALAWTRMMKTHATQWSKYTGRSVDEYFARFGFGLDETINRDASISVLSNYLSKSDNGTFTFYGNGNKDLKTLLSQSYRLFFNDLADMANYSDEMADVYRTITKSMDENKFVQEFNNYVLTGEAKTNSLRRVFNKFKSWLSDEFKVVKMMKESPEMSDEVYSALNKISIEESIKPTLNIEKRLQEIIDAINNPSVTPELIVKEVNESIYAPETLDWAEFAHRAYELADEPHKQLLTNILETLNEYLTLETKTDAQFLEETILKTYLIKTIESSMDDTIEHYMTSPSTRGRYFDDMMYGIIDSVVKNQGLDTMNLSKLDKIKLVKEIMENNESNTILDVVKTDIKELTNWFLDGLDKLTVKHKPLKEMTLKEIEDAAIAFAQKNGIENIPNPRSAEIDLAWKSWKQNRDLAQFPASVLNTSDQFKAYLRYRIDNEPWNISQAYERILFDLQNMEDAVLGVKKFTLAPTEFQINNGMRTFLRNAADNIGTYEETLQQLDKLKKHLIEGKWNLPVVSKETAKMLEEWKAVAVQSKANLVDLLLNGGKLDGRTIKGAIQRTNDIMLDYTDQSRFDHFMKNFFPFWMFPSRSLPFWVKTVATHPELIAFYNKMQRWSESFRRQAGAVTSTGEPIQSLEGYIPVPGTDMWINPLAPLSFRYILGIPNALSRVADGFDTNRETELDPVSWIAREVLETGPMFGFTVAPWITWILKNNTNVPDSSIPHYPIAPELPLIPRWTIPYLVQLTTNIGLGNLYKKLFGANLENQLNSAANFIYPEVPWIEPLIERRILQNALGTEDENGNVDLAAVEAARLAMIERKGNALWDETYIELSNEQATQSWMSFFTGFYPKEFSDGQAEMYAVRNELNLLKSALNNKLQRTVFFPGHDAEQLWNKYLSLNDMDNENFAETELYRLYVQSGWVRDENNLLITDPVERAKYLVIALQEEQNQMNYYAGRKEADKVLQERIANLPIGSSFDVISKAYDEYFDTLDKLEKAFPFTFDEYYGTNKPIELIQRDLTNEYFKLLLSTRPTFDADDMTYTEYQDRVKNWESNLPELAPRLLSRFKGRENVNRILVNLSPQQQMNPDFWINLAEMNTLAGLESWQLGEDSLFDALNKAWTDLYWRPYWDLVTPLEGSQRDLAEHDFMANRPPPTSEEMFTWILSKYGNRFTLEQIREWVDGTETLDVQQRIQQQQTQEERYRNQIWDYMSWLGPVRDKSVLQALNTELAKMGFDKELGLNGDILDDLMQRNTHLFRGEPEILQALAEALATIYKEKNINPPTREQLVEFVQAQEANEQFKELVRQRLKTGDDVDAYEYVMGIQADYNSLNDRYSQSEYRRLHREEYAILQQYYQMRKAFGYADRIWAKHYYWNLPKAPDHLKGLFGLDSGNNEEEVQGEMTNTVGSSSSGGGGGYTRSVKPEREGKEPKNNIVNSGANTASSPIYKKSVIAKTLGRSLMSDIDALYAKGKPLTRQAMAFLSGVLQRHPEWADTLQQVIVQNNTLDL